MLNAAVVLALSQSADVALEPNLLTIAPTFWHDSQAQATYSSQSGEHRVRVSETGPKPWGVQFYWQVPPTIARSRMRLTFSHRGNPGLTFQVRVQQVESPHGALGFDQTFETSNEWKSEKFEFETPYYAFDFLAPVFWLSSSPGEFAFRGVALRRLGPAVLQVTPILSESGIFEWYDLTPTRFKAKDVDSLVGQWAADYVEHNPYSKEPGKLKIDRATALLELSRQAMQEVKHNGPAIVCVSSISTKADTATVKGFAAGAYRSVDASGRFIEGQYSWQGQFEDKWQLRDGRWLLVSNTTKQGYLDVTSDEVSRIKAAHKALGDKLGVKVAQK